MGLFTWLLNGMNATSTARQNAVRQRALKRDPEVLKPSGISENTLKSCLERGHSRREGCLLPNSGELTKIRKQDCGKMFMPAGAKASFLQMSPWSTGRVQAEEDL